MVDKRNEGTRIPLPLYQSVMMVTAMLLTGTGSLLPRLSEARWGWPMSRQGLLVSGQFLGFTAAVLSGAVLAVFRRRTAREDVQPSAHTMTIAHDAFDNRSDKKSDYRIRLPRSLT